MHSIYEDRLAEASSIQRNIVQGAATICSPNFAKVCKAIWPHKTAEELAAITGCSVRTASYEISEDRPSAQSVAAIVAAITPKRK
jgi:hypothetical protein